MRTCFAVFRLRFNYGLQYRTAAFAGIATQFFWGFILIMVYQAFFAMTDRTTQPISLEQVVAYIWLQQAFIAFIMLWFRDQELFDLITTGNVAYELCRPSGLYSFWYAKVLAQRLSAGLLRCGPILLLAGLMPGSYRLTMPLDAATFVLFVVTLLLGLLLVAAITMLIHISVFYTMSPVGSLLVFQIAGEFMAGMIIPVPLMPEWLQRIVHLFPFRWTADFPFRVFSGHIGHEEALVGIVMQMLWLAVLIFVGKALMQKALRRVVVQGG